MNYCRSQNSQQNAIFTAFLNIDSQTIDFKCILYICDRLWENRAQRGVRKYREKIDRFLKNVLFQADGRERLGLL